MLCAWKDYIRRCMCSVLVPCFDAIVIYSCLKLYLGCAIPFGERKPYVDLSDPSQSWITLLPPASAGVHPCPRGGRLPHHWQGQSHTHNRRHTTVSCQARRGSVGSGASGGGEYELIIHSTSLNRPLYKDSDYMHSTTVASQLLQL